MGFLGNGESVMCDDDGVSMEFVAWKYLGFFGSSFDLASTTCRRRKLRNGSEENIEKRDCLRITGL